MATYFTNGRAAPVFHCGSVLDCGGRSLELGSARVMGILNVTPDSFSDGGELMTGGKVSLAAVIDRAAGMITAGADLLDVGGESTRPGAVLVSAEQELERVVPVVEALAARFDAVVSVDTSRAPVMTAAASAGAGMLNDVRSLQGANALSAAAATGLPVCLMHMQGQPATMQAAPVYGDVVEDVLHFLLQRVEACEAAGIDRQQIVLDPGFGFGKELAHNLSLAGNLGRFVDTGFPVLAGLSRKSMIGAVTGRAVEQRLAGSLALASLAVAQGAAIVRVHDVAETRDVVAVMTAIIRGQTQ